MAACLKYTRRVWQSFVKTQGHDMQCFPNLVIEKATPGVVHTSMKIESYNVNRVGAHGGLILSLTDTLGSLAVASKGYWMTGVSTDVGASFVRPAGRVGDVLYAKSTLTALGKSLAYTRTDFTNAAGDLVAYGYHTKYVGKSGSHEKNVKLSEDGETLVEGQDLDVD
ncbi:thioesterase thiol ester dehydrase-isomerase [Cylindrobasidium torrendii FP15055 ss-10]|uniref:Thioesterase thiol ester dehydrase-isomerase n=1 Tax=Cylindrobasidium torrendii FP15055 ss-10 TaxID=1314674 RepID=A0A0D7BFM0_9AGAR|nr:thioesterase thiol ester dehydrase-isomerase [Cylindrobasidium torrendii FP15055 ss-10]